MYQYTIVSLAQEGLAYETIATSGPAEQFLAQLKYCQAGNLMAELSEPEFFFQLTDFENYRLACIRVPVSHEVGNPLNWGP